MSVKVQAMGYLANAGIANSQCHVWSKASLQTSILQSTVPSVGIDRIVTAIMVNYKLDLTSQQTSSRLYTP